METVGSANGPSQPSNPGRKGELKKGKKGQKVGQNHIFVYTDQKKAHKNVTG